MKIKVNSKNMQEVVKMCGSVTGGPPHMNIVADKKGAWLTASGNDTFVKIKLDAKVVDKGAVTVDQAQVLGILRGRDELLLSVEGKKQNSLTFSSLKGSKYNGALVVPPFEKIDVVSASDDKSIKFNAGLQTLLLEAVSKISLSSVYDSNSMQVWVVCDGKSGTTVMCADEYHIAHYHHPEVNVGKKNFSIPLNMFKTLQQISRNTPYELTIRDNQVFAKNEELEVSMPLAKLESKVGAKEFESLVSGLTKNEGSFTVDKAQLQKVLDNMSSMYEREIPVRISSEGSNIVVNFDTNYGKIKETLEAKLKGKPDLYCDPVLLADTISPITDKELTFRFTNGSNLFVRVKQPPVTVTYLCCLVSK